MGRRTLLVCQLTVMVLVSLVLAATPSEAATRPAVTALSVPGGPLAGGAKVTIKGLAFRHVRAVRFGSVRARILSVVSPTKLVVRAPRAARVGTVMVTVTTSGGTSKGRPSARYSYMAVPAVRSVTPGLGSTAGGQSVALAGSGFTGSVRVYFGSTRATAVTVSSASALSVTVPAHGAATVPVSVRTLGGTSAVSSATRYRFRTPPAISPTPSVAAVGQPYSAQLTTVDGRAGVWSVQPAVSGGQALPPGVALSGSTLAGTPRSSGVFHASLTFTDDVGMTTSRPLALQVSDGWRPEPVPMPKDVAALGQDYPSMPVQACTPDGPTCVGAGSYRAASTNERHALWVRDDGTWSGSAAPLPSDAWSIQQPTMLAAACSARTVCAVLGSYLTPDGGSHPVLWTYGHGGWSVTSLPMPDDYLVHGGGIQGSELSCGDSGICAAVLRSSGSGSTIVSNVTGSWQATAPTAPEDADSPADPALWTVSCQLHCVVGGEYVDATPASAGALWTGTSTGWTVRRAPTSTGAGSAAVRSVTCGAGDICVASGTDSAGDFLLWRESAGSWRASTALARPAGSDIDALGSRTACGSGGLCAVSNSYGAATGEAHAVVSTYTNGAWATHDLGSPNPSSTTTPSAVIGEIACGGSVCVAEGSYGKDSSAPLAPAVWWSSGGSAWQLVPLDLPADAITPADVELFSDACTGSGTCIVQGSYRTSSDGPRHLVAWTYAHGTWAASSPAGVVGGQPYQGQEIFGNPPQVHCASSACLVMDANWELADDARLVMWVLPAPAVTGP